MEPRTRRLSGPAVLCGLAAAWALGSPPVTALSEEPARPSARVAVVAPLDVATGDPGDQGLGETVGEVLAVALAGRKGVAVVERRRLADVLAEQKLAASGLVGAETAARVGALLAADLVVAGSVLKDGDGDRLRFAVRVVAVDGRRVVGAVESVGPRAELDRVAIDLAGKVANLAGVDLPAVRPEDLDDSPDGRLHLMRGVSFFYEMSYDRSIASCLRAAQLDPRLVEARLWVARSYLALGEPDHARAELARLARNPAARPLSSRIDALLKECGPAAERPAGR